MPNPTDPNAVVTPLTLVIATSTIKTPGFSVGNPTEIGLIVPTIASSILTIQVSHEDVDASYKALFDRDGTAVLTYAAGTGNFAISCNDFGAVIAYPFFRVLFGTAQGADRVFQVVRKVSQVNNTS